MDYLVRSFSSKGWPFLGNIWIFLQFLTFFGKLGQILWKHIIFWFDLILGPFLMILCFDLCTPSGYSFFKIMTSWLILTSFCNFGDFLGPWALPNAQRNPTGTWHFSTLDVNGWRSCESPRDSKDSCLRWVRFLKKYTFIDFCWLSCLLFDLK